MTVEKTWLFICDGCDRAVESSGSGVPKGWYVVTHQRQDGSRLDHAHFCSEQCLVSEAGQVLGGLGPKQN